METKALKAKRPGFSDDRYNETQYYVENGKKHLFQLLLHILKGPEHILLKVKNVEFDNNVP